MNSLVGKAVWDGALKQALITITDQRCDITRGLKRTQLVPGGSRLCSKQDPASRLYSPGTSSESLLSLHLHVSLYRDSGPEGR